MRQPVLYWFTDAQVPTPAVSLVRGYDYELGSQETWVHNLTAPYEPWDPEPIT